MDLNLVINLIGFWLDIVIISIMKKPYGIVVQLLQMILVVLQDLCVGLTDKSIKYHISGNRYVVLLTKLIYIMKTHSIKQKFGR
jgi:hypothetical protein